jgi:hypothetical protein
MWEWEGGRTGGDEESVAIDEEHILQSLGAAVIMRWTSLPTDVQRELFASAVSLKNPLPVGEKQIACFLHTHKDV